MFSALFCPTGGFADGGRTNLWQAHSNLRDQILRFLIAVGTQEAEGLVETIAFRSELLGGTLVSLGRILFKSLRAPFKFSRAMRQTGSDFSLWHCCRYAKKCPAASNRACTLERFAYQSRVPD
jgi:hypothetical protein